MDYNNGVLKLKIEKMAKLLLNSENFNSPFNLGLNRLN